MARVILFTMKRGESAHVQRLLEHKQHAEQLERFIADTPWVYRDKLLAMADEELNTATANWQLWQSSKGITDTDPINIDIASGVVSKEVPDGLDSESGIADDTVTDPEGTERDGSAA